jgi:hypothetical protein
VCIYGAVPAQHPQKINNFVSKIFKFTHKRQNNSTTEKSKKVALGENSIFNKIATGMAFIHILLFIKSNFVVYMMLLVLLLLLFSNVLLVAYNMQNEIDVLLKRTCLGCRKIV